MVAEALTQAEIDALLSGSPMPDAPADGGGGGGMITAEEEDTVNSYAGFVAGSSKNVLGTLTGEAVNITVEGIEEVDAETVGSAMEGTLVATTFGYKGAVTGDTVLLLKTDDAAKLANQMTGGGGEGEFGDLEESALSETLSQIVNGANTELSVHLGGELQLDLPDVRNNPDNVGDVLPASDRKQILVRYNVESSAFAGSMCQILPRNLIENLQNVSDAPVAAAETPRSYGEGPGVAIMEQPAAFQPAAAPVGISVDTTNLDLILDISLDIKVELGRSNKKIREVLELGPGSVVELDKLAGEPVDILVNNKLFAKGEVVVNDENFGVRITDILSIADRIEALK